MTQRDDEPVPADLRALAEVARRGSIAGAASALGVSQQAVSARIRSLESRLQVTLLTRSSSGSRLTETGDLVVAWAEDALVAWDRLSAGIRSLRSTHARRLRVAASQTVAESMLPGWLLRLRSEEEASGIAPTAVDLVVGNSTDVAGLVRRREVDLGFVETPRLPGDLRGEPVTTDEVVVVAHPRHPWVGRRTPVGLEELAATGLVLREAGSGTRDTFAAALADAHLSLQPTVLLELATTASVRSAIVAGIAPGVLSRRLVRDDLVLGRLAIVEIAADPMVRPITALSFGSGDPPAEARSLIEIAAS